ncbi:hypothetical protein SAMD00019534_087310 [Acytostelium subglobosum LB1]|uniref:hypothetical protein n=1 Tax=Acytostelium subglobosum LB1 TaxID=1410327 RepID=UPI0006451AC7|nr:hypothetical protein SAMD00019534_087310 [Acytostelium subglobosum LB1]GAM25556.1 hypothetical protein SAMD00019534_087310 [Acytostelium subglobosum LB1]|eukprot:XP_012751542.1 hypothetical protein SAMD00019534_087310 [Acytostelium subglobosum LB1]
MDQLIQQSQQLAKQMENIDPSTPTPTSPTTTTTTTTNVNVNGSCSVRDFSGIAWKTEGLHMPIETEIGVQARLAKSRRLNPNACFPVENKVMCLPNYIIIGSMKAGTTFLDYYLQQHPLMAKHTKKEIWFFNSYYSKGIKWYVEHFEPVIGNAQTKVIGEATPFYINHPFTPERMYSTLKDVKLILLMRDPVERVLSQYYFSIKWIEKNNPKMMKPKPFKDMIYEEADVIETCVRGNQRFLEQVAQYERDHPGAAIPDDWINPFFVFHSSKNWTFYKDCKQCDRCFPTGNVMHMSGHPTFGMLAKSLYYDQIDQWLKYYPLDQFLFVRYEDIKSYPENVLREVEQFLELPPYDYGDFAPKNVVPHEPMDEDIREFLVDYFRPHNEKLYRTLNRDFEWST